MILSEPVLLAVVSIVGSAILIPIAYFLFKRGAWAWSTDLDPEYVGG